MKHGWSNNRRHNGKGGRRKKKGVGIHPTCRSL